VQGSISLDQLEKIRLLGEGEFGEVWMVAADVFQTGVPELRQKFALKSQLRQDRNRGKDATTDILREIDILKEIDHPQVVNLVNTYQDEDSIHILMDLIPGGELWDLIHQEDDKGNWKSGLPEGHAKFVTMVVADTLDFIHSKDMIFRDLKPGK
jgi:serine/threonine protein kinase